MTDLAELREKIVGLFTEGLPMDADLRALVAQVIDINTTISATSFGAVGDGVADDTDAVQKLVDYVKSGGGVGFVPEGTYYVSALTLGSGTERWTLRGAGVGRTIFKRLGNASDNIMNCASSSVGFDLEDFSVDGSHDVASNGGQAIAVGNASNVRIRRVNVYNYKNTGILVYADTAHTQENVIVEECETDGGSAAEAGIIIADMDHCGITRCRAKNCTGGVGFGIELKNACDYCFVSDCYAENCIDGFGIGNTSGTTGVRWSTWTNLRAYDNTIAWISSHSSFNVIHGFAINQNENVGHCIRLETGDSANAFSAITAQNISATRGVVYCKSTAANNSFRIDCVDDLNAGAKIVEFDTAASGNTVILERCTTALPAGGVPALVNFNADSGAGSAGNGFAYRGFATWESVTIASGIATCSNILSEAISILGEGGVADQLDSVVGLNKTEGRVLQLRAASAGASPITVADGTDFDMAGGASMVLDGQNDTLQVRYTGTSVSKWCELCRANNG